MALVHRTLTLWPLIGLVCTPLAADAAKLTVLDGSEAVQSSVDLTSVHFEPGTKRLVVSTSPGNVDCGSESTLAAGELGLVVNDGTARTYALRTTSLPAGREPIKYVLANSDVQVVLPASVGTSCKSNNVTDVKLQFDAGHLLSVAERVNFRLDDKTFDIRINESVLCYSYAALGSDLKVSLTSPAEASAVLLPGFTAVNYILNGKVLNALSGDSTQCLDFTQPFGQQAAEIGSADRVFDSRFEQTDVQADLVVRAQAINGGDPISVVAASGDRPFQYQIEIRNDGNGAAGGVQVRELLPPGTQATSWSCMRYANSSDLTGTACTAANTSARLDHAIGTIGPDQIVVYTLNRQIVGGSIGNSYTLGAAAFVNPASGVSGERADFNLANNSDPVTVQLIANQPPVISAPTVVAYEDGGAADPQDPTLAGAPFSIPLSFTDSDSATLTVTAVTTNSGAGLPATIAALPTLAAAGSTFTGNLQLPATGKDRNGSVTVTVTVNDGSSSNSFPITFGVLARNDAPVFTLSTNAINVAACAGTCAESLVTGFVSGIAAGSPTALAHDEGGQTAVASLDAFDRITCASLPSGFFSGNLNPRLTSAGNLVFQLGGVSGTATCSITVVDVGGSPQGVTTKTFDISYASLPPTISGAPTSAVALNEDNGAPTPPDVIFTVADSDGLAVGSPSIASNSPLILGASLVATGSPNEWRVVFAPVADKNGSGIQFTVSATDTQSSTATATFSANVAPVNDTPTFTLNVAGAAMVVTEGDAGCAPAGSCTASATGFVTNLQPGPASAGDESTQTIRPNTAMDGFGDQRLVAGSCRAAAVDGVAPATFFTDGALPRVTEPTPGTFNLIGSLTRTVGAVECDITVIDTGAPAATSALQTVTIRYQVPPPP